MMVGALHDPFDVIHMGVTAENVAKQVGHHASAAGCAGRREPSPRRRGDQGRALQEPDRADRGQGQEGPDGVRHRRALPRGHVDGRHGQAEAGVREGKRHGDRGQRVGHQRRRRRGRADGAHGRRKARAQAAGAAGELRPCRCRSEDHGHRTGAGDAQGAREGGPQGRRSRRHRGQRGVCRAGLRGGQGPRISAGEGQSERQRHLARPPDRRHRRDHHDQGAVRVAAQSAAATRW